MPDQPNDTPPQPEADEPTTEIDPTTEATATPEPGETGPVASEPKQSWAAKPVHVTRAIVMGTAAGVLLVGGVFGFAIGATLAGDDHEAHGPGRGGSWQRDDRDPGDMPGPGWPGDMGEQGPHWYIGPDGGQDGFGQPPGGEQSTPEGTTPDDSDSGT